jgi:hypothetical protein
VRLRRCGPLPLPDVAEAEPRKPHVPVLLQNKLKKVFLLRVLQMVDLNLLSSINHD